MMHHLDLLLITIGLLTCVVSSSSKALSNDELNGNNRVVRSAHSSPFDTLTSMLGCNLLDAVSLLMCSSSNRGESYHSAVHFPTKLIVSQLDHELSSGSMNKPQALEKLTNAITLLNSVVQDDQQSPASSSPNLQAQLSMLSSLLPSTNIEQTMASMNELVKNYDNNEKSQRDAVQKTASMPQQLPSVARPQNSGNPVLEPASVLERPPLASTDSQMNEQPQLPQLGAGGLVPASNNQGSRTIRDTSFSDSALKSIPSFASQDCSIANLASTFCSHADVQEALQTLIVTYANAITNVNEARNMLLNNVVQAPACSAPGVAGNQISWASLGSSERSLVSILSTLLDAQKKIAMEKEIENNNGASTNTKSGSTNGFGSFTNSIGGILPEASNLMTSSMGQLPSAASSYMNQNTMDSLIKSFGQGQKKLFGFFG